MRECQSYVVLSGDYPLIQRSEKDISPVKMAIIVM